MLGRAADCSAAPDTACARLFRYPCRRTAGTCGPCLFGFFGQEGDANAGCFDLQVRG